VTRALWGLLLPTLVYAQAASYNQPPPASRPSPLVARVDALVADVAKKERRELLRPDARLDAAAAEIARAVPDRGPPANELVQGALWVHGLVEPSPHLILATMTTGGEDALLAQLARDLPAVLKQGRFVRVGVGLVPVAGDTRVLVALQESFVDLEPVARALPVGATVSLRGRLHSGFVRPEAFVTAPDGKVLTRMPLGGDSARFAGSFRCGPEQGRYQVEVTGEDRFGATVLANFPIWCGVPAPSSAQAVAPARASGGGDEQAATPAQAEQVVLRLLNADRARAGLGPLAWDDALAGVARGHSLDMAAHGFFGHVSPTTGSAADRMRRAGVDAMLILENVARAFTPGEAERGLMNSPGHRANILNRDATHVGVGVAFDGSSGRELLVTQLFSRPPEKFDANTIVEVRKQIAALRQSRRLAALEHEPALDELAQSTARERARHNMSTEEAGRRIDDAIGRQGTLWHSARTLFATVSAGTQVATALRDALSDASATHIGLGIEPGRRSDGGSGLFVVIILATRR
jgi:uncharacterized protein YkwD